MTIRSTLPKNDEIERWRHITLSTHSACAVGFPTLAGEMDASVSEIATGAHDAPGYLTIQFSRVRPRMLWISRVWSPAAFRSLRS